MTAKSLVVPALAAALLVGGAVAHGRWTDRWGAPAERLAAADRARQFPATLGDWDGTDLPMGEQELAIANVTGYASRKYIHRYTKAELTMLLVCGRPGSVGAHPPEVCYSSLGYTPGEKKTRPLAGGGEAWTAPFTRTAPNPDSLRIAWAWGVNGKWAASGAPRTEYAAEPYLYKFYAVQRVPASPGPKDEEALNGFLDAFATATGTCLAVRP